MESSKNLQDLWTKMRIFIKKLENCFLIYTAKSLSNEIDCSS